MKRILLSIRKQIRSDRLLFIIFVAVIFLTFAVVTVKTTAPHYSDKITVEALGVKNELSGGADIGISSVRIGFGSMDLSQINSWGFTGNVLTWGFREARSFEITAPIYSKVKITFESNVWAGQVRIVGRGVDKTLDLYSEDDGEQTFVVDAEAPLYVLKRMSLVGLALLAELMLSILICALEFVPAEPARKLPEP